ncbi:MAG: ABC transporter, partial [Dietzia cercidiphylli]
MDVGIGTYTAMGFDEAVEATREALADRGFGILHEIDLTATLKKKIDKDIERVLILG